MIPHFVYKCGDSFTQLFKYHIIQLGLVKNLFFSNRFGIINYFECHVFTYVSMLLIRFSMLLLVVSELI